MRRTIGTLAHHAAAGQRRSCGARLVGPGLLKLRSALALRRADRPAFPSISRCTPSLKRSANSACSISCNIAEAGGFGSCQAARSSSENACFNVVSRILCPVRQVVDVVREQSSGLRRVRRQQQGHQLRPFYVKAISGPGARLDRAPPLLQDVLPDGHNIECLALRVYPRNAKNDVASRVLRKCAATKDCLKHGCPSR